MLNTGGKYDTKAFKKSVGLNGVGAKAVNALSSRFVAWSARDGQMRKAVFERGELVSDETCATDEENGTCIFFELPCSRTTTSVRSSLRPCSATIPI